MDATGISLLVFGAKNFFCSDTYKSWRLALQQFRDMIAGIETENASCDTDQWPRLSNLTRGQLEAAKTHKTCWRSDPIGELLQRVAFPRMSLHANANAHRPTLRLDLTVTSGVTRGWMARGSHSFTCHPHVYPRMEWAILQSACIS